MLPNRPHETYPYLALFYAENTASEAQLEKHLSNPSSKAELLQQLSKDASYNWRLLEIELPAVTETLTVSVIPLKDGDDEIDPDEFIEGSERTIQANGVPSRTFHRIGELQFEAPIAPDRHFEDMDCYRSEGYFFELDVREVEAGASYVLAKDDFSEETQEYAHCTAGTLPGGTILRAALQAALIAEDQSPTGKVSQLTHSCQELNDALHGFQSDEPHILSEDEKQAVDRLVESPKLVVAFFHYPDDYKEEMQKALDLEFERNGHLKPE